MSLALYRKYRSKSFETIVGQDHITRTLQKSVDNNTFSHAYLLTGLRGVGKTSIARIFAAYVNGIKYEEAANNPDIIEIDAASNRKIDEIRDLREKVNISPTSLKYKVYIIDEVHMLTREAFNALLKTLEEPPKHCILILATTDYHKLPETIISRCIRFSFRPISNVAMVDHLDEIASKEKIKTNKKALQAIAENSSGSLRDAITILDQARNMSDDVNLEEIELLLGLANRGQISSLYNALEANDTQGVVNKIKDIRNTGANPAQVISQLTKLIRDKIVLEQVYSKNLDLLAELMKIEEYSDKWLSLEVCLLKHTLEFRKTPQNKPAEDKQTNPPEPDLNKQQEVYIKNQGKITATVPEGDLWQNILNELKKTNSTLYGVARMAESSINKDMLELKLKFSFHKKQLDLKRNQMRIVEIANKYNPDIKSVSTIAIKESKASPENQKYNGEKAISNISNVFGSAEMLE